jgi:hypothetical protein
MRARLTNYEFRAYLKRTGVFWLHLRTHVLFETNTSFSVPAYLRNITGTLRLHGGSSFEIDGVGVEEAASTKYDGQTKVHWVLLTIPTQLVALSVCLADLTLCFHFNFHGADIVANVEHLALIRPIRQTRASRRHPTSSHALQS